MLEHVETARVLRADLSCHIRDQFPFNDPQHLHLGLWLQPIVCILLLSLHCLLHFGQVLGTIALLAPLLGFQGELFSCVLQKRQLEVFIVEGQVPVSLPKKDVFVLNRFRLQKSHINEDLDGLL